MMLHTWDVVGNDILPMIQAYHSGAAELILDAGVHTLFFPIVHLLSNIFVSAVKLLVFLTLPADPRSTNLNEQRHYINRTVQSLTKNSCAVIFSHMAEPLERFESGRLHLRDEDGRTIQLFLTFVRNLLLSYRENFPGNAPSSSQRVQPKVSFHFLQRQLIWLNFWHAGQRSQHTFWFALARFALSDGQGMHAFLSEGDFCSRDFNMILSK